MYFNYLADLFIPFPPTDIHWTVDKKDNELGSGLKIEKLS